MVKFTVGIIPGLTSPASSARAVATGSDRLTGRKPVISTVAVDNMEELALRCSWSEQSSPLNER